VSVYKQRVISCWGQSILCTDCYGL